MEAKNQETKLSLSQKMKDVFVNKVELSLQKVVEESGFDEKEVKEYIKQTGLYALNEESGVVQKSQLLRLKLYVLSTEDSIETPIKELIPVLEAQLSNIPYVRFNSGNGHLVVEEITVPAVEKLMETGFKIDDKTIKIIAPDIEEKRKFSRDHAMHLEGILRGKLGKGVAFIVDGLLTTRKGVYLGHQKFRSVTEVRDYFGKLLKKAEVGTKLVNPESDLMKELIKYHNKGEDKMKGFDHFEINYHPEHNDTKCFLIVRDDGSKEDFSYVKCVKKISELVKKN